MSGVNRLFDETKQQEYEKYIKNESECVFCRYKFNKNHLNKCPICSVEVKKK